MTQQKAIEIMLSGANVFLTGAPGAGKTFTLNQYIEQAKERDLKVAVSASTGIAASHINGVTLHSWSGLGIEEMLTPALIEKLMKNGRIRKRYKNAHTLIIDEVSMLHGHRLDMVNEMAKKFRGNTRAFGGMQVIMVGDLFQLPPVTRGSSAFDFVHKSQAWAELGPKVAYITEQHRQEGHDPLLELLQAMRQNTVTESHRQLLRDRAVKAPADVTRLFTHNADVDTLNDRELAKLTKPAHHYAMESEGDPYKIQILERNVLAPKLLSIKEDAEVMFVANNFQEGYVNGSRGTVTGFRDNDPVVKLKDGRKIIVTEHEWAIKGENERGEEVIEAAVRQLPLRLAWAVTVHKSQGMSLDAAEIDLSRAFTPGMGYVALSRVRSLDGLYLAGFAEMALKMHGEIHDLDRALLAASEVL